MNNLRITIPKPILEYAKFSYGYYVPQKRRSGFYEIKGQSRGDGDLSDLIGKLTLFDYLAKKNKVCGMEMICGQGDSLDLSIQINNKKISWNIKTSAYSPYRQGLNLFIKKEEIEKNINGYIQVFVHLNEESDPEPHIHVAGCVIKNSKNWEKNKNIICIPKTGHYGIKVPVEDLKPFETLALCADEKF